MTTPGSKEETKRNVVETCDDCEGVYELIDDDDDNDDNFEIKDAVFELRAADDFDIDWVMSSSGWSKSGSHSWKR